jgi:hypothetical protein
MSKSTEAANHLASTARAIGTIQARLVASPARVTGPLARITRIGVELLEASQRATTLRPSPAETPDAYAARLAKSGRQLEERVGIYRNRMADEVSSVRRELSEAVAKAADIRPRSTDAEIRQAIRGLDPEARREIAYRLMSGEMPEVASAIFTLTPELASLTTGFQPNEITATREIYTAKRAPAETELLRELEDLAGDLPAVTGIAASAATTMRSLTPVGFDSAVSAAEAAQRAFDEATSTPAGSAP